LVIKQWVNKATLLQKYIQQNKTFFQPSGWNFSHAVHLKQTTF